MYRASKNTNPVVRGMTITSRGGSTYKVVATSAKGFTIKRSSSGKTVKISGKCIEKTLARLERGEEIKFQCSGNNGGISYTVAIEAGVAGALEPLIKVDSSRRVYLRR